MEAKLEEAKQAIKGGFFAAIFSLGITLLITILGATGTADLGFGADWLMLVDVGLIAVCAIGLWFKSRTAATIMFIYFLLSKIFLWAEGNFNGIIMGVLFLFFYGRAMMGSFRYHALIKKHAQNADVF